MPSLSPSQPPNLPAPGEIAPRTLLLDGLWSLPGRMEPMRRFLAMHCGEVGIFRYDCSARKPFSVLGEALATAVETAGRPVNLVGFSMGGLVIRSALLARPSLPVQNVVFLNTPHHGSTLAHLLPLRGLVEMRPGSPFLREIEAASWAFRSLCVWCPGDMMVVPGFHGRWDRATEVVRSEMPAHIWPLFSRRIHRMIADFLQETTSAETSEKKLQKL